MDELNQADNAVVENNTQTTEGVATPTKTETNTTPETTQQVNNNDNNVVDITTTQAFSQRLKESTQKAIDAEYSRLYGADYGIHTKADYDAAIAKQRQAEEAERLGIDPEDIKPFFETWKQNDPDFQELSQIRQENNVRKALTDLNNELKDNGIDLQLTDLSDAEISKLPNVDKVIEHVSKGHTLADAVFLANKKEFLSKKAEAVQKETIKKIAANADSSPGSLTSANPEDNHITSEMFEAKKSDPKWVQNNYDLIQKSRSKW